MSNDGPIENVVGNAVERAGQKVGQAVGDIGSYIRAQREGAQVSLRQLAKLAGVSNPYLSQVERGLHEPSVRVLTSIASALNLSAETLLRGAGLLDGESEAARRRETEEVIATDPLLRDDQRETLLAVYRNYLEVNADRDEH